jgi:hypothetical protein
LSCRHSPSATRYRIRSASWWARIAESAADSAVSSRSPASSSVTDWSNRSGSTVTVSKNQRWIGVSGAGPDTGPSSAVRGAASATVPASAATVG